MKLAEQKKYIQNRHNKRGLDKWNKEDCGLAVHRNKAFYKADGMLPYDTRKGLLYETPNWELISEVLRRICVKEIDVKELINFLDNERYKNL